MSMLRSTQDYIIAANIYAYACNADTHDNSCILHAMAQPFVAGKIYLRASLKKLYLSNIYFAH